MTKKIKPLNFGIRNTRAIIIQTRADKTEKRDVKKRQEIIVGMIQRGTKIAISPLRQRKNVILKNLWDVF